jgi:hypothetical protein
MRSVIGGFVVAVLLFAAAFVCWSEAQRTRSMAVARERLATVHYDVDDGMSDGPSIVERVPLPVSTLGADIGRYRATVAYWQARYRDLVGRLPSAGGNVETTTDVTILLLAANASFRTAQADTSNRAATIDRLDRVIQAYADVLRVDPASSDASFNYEYVARFRDSFARARPARRTDKPEAKPVVDTSPDLPVGPTIHGRPGGPPPDIPMDQFRTITPMRFEEREESEPGQGATRRRKG